MAQTVYVSHTLNGIVWVKCPSCANINKHSFDREGHRVCDQPIAECPGYLLKRAAKVKEHTDWEKYRKVLLKQEGVALPGVRQPRKKPSSWGQCAKCNHAHSFAVDALQIADCVPPKNVLQFGDDVLPKDYREELYATHPTFTVAEVLGCFFGEAPERIFPSGEAFKQQKRANKSRPSKRTS